MTKIYHNPRCSKSRETLKLLQEAEYKELGLNNPELSDDALVEAMIATPKLIERPIVVNGKKAALGRPPEQVLDIL